MDKVLRPLTAEEKKEITPLGSTSLLDLFLKELAKKVSEYQKNYKPFDSYGARIDFDNNIKIKLNEISAAVDKDTVAKFDFGDLDKYGKSDLFKFLEKHEQEQTRLVAGIKQEVVIGNRYRFRCKTRGNTVSILIPNKKIESFEKWLDTTYLKKDKKVESDDESKSTVKTPTKKPAK